MLPEADVRRFSEVYWLVSGKRVPFINRLFLLYALHRNLPVPCSFLVMLSLSHNQTIARKACLSSLGTHGFHMSRTRRGLVAPPNPVSHMRPVIYDDPPSKLRLPHLRHPYSLSEFKDGNTSVLGNCELQFRLLRQQLDSLHQNFWLDVSDPILSCEMFLPLERATPVSTLLENPSSAAFLRQLPRVIRRRRYLHFTSNG
jgi:hypothetical protein